MTTGWQKRFAIENVTEWSDWIDCTGTAAAELAGLQHWQVRATPAAKPTGFVEFKFDKVIEVLTAAKAGLLYLKTIYYTEPLPVRDARLLGPICILIDTDKTRGMGYKFWNGQRAQREDIKLMVAAPPTGVRDDFLHGICVALTAVHAFGNGTLWAEIVRTANTADILYYAAHIEPDEWELAGFKHWAWQELRERKPEAK